MISVCIPVFNTESTLLRALESVCEQVQSFNENCNLAENEKIESSAIEIVVVNDFSNGKDKDGRSAKKIVNAFKKKNKISVTYIENSFNMGLVETRRTLVEASSGTYITMLDSDDKILSNALLKMYDVAKKTGADIVCGKSEVTFLNGDVFDENASDYANEYAKKRKNNINAFFVGELSESSVLDNFLIEKKQTSYLWAKLVKKEVYEKAFSFIPFVRCTFAEDYLIYPLLCAFAKKYVGIENYVYMYSVDTGVSSFRKITSLKNWEQVCTAASVFSALSDIIQNNENLFTQNQVIAIRKNCTEYLANNIVQLKTAVVPELYEEAHALLCEYWGKEFVERIEGKMKSQNST
ncbi:MAG: glycosyltransferase family 2 protein [Treponema sp.]|nr:glycosyltransferase family 2 protein [Treponema sp.]